ncbi:MAG: CmcJ/NvfI family oxidoreductase [Deltaproteobacteria bacterium]|nr:CmcJ/NvfI family oxidoreductase [Deltaproteobacteria bacterium]
MAKPQEAIQPETIQGVVNYLSRDTEAPASYGGLSQKEADRKRKGDYERHTVTIHNARLLAGDLSLEREGFVLVRHDTQMKDFYDEEELRSVYYKETEELVKKTSGAKRVVVFDHTLRSGDEATREAKQVGGPVRGAHNDYTDWSGPQRVRDILPDEAEELLKGRFAVVQTWRPINRPVIRDPLAICDARSTGMEGAIPTARIYPDRRGETLHYTFNPDHYWYYFPHMERHEAVVFKTFESEKDGRARWTLHSAFDDPDTPSDAPPRESIEMRTLAFF